MPSLLKDVKLTLFGSNSNRIFKTNKSLSENFKTMCSLSCVKKDSDETSELRRIIDSCKLGKDYKGETYEDRSNKRMQDIAQLCLVKYAIQAWHRKRDNASTRVSLIKAFEQNVEQLLKSLIITDNQDASRNVQTWEHPLFGIDNIFSLRNYLANDDQKQTFTDLFSQTHVSINSDAPKPSACIKY